MPEPPIQRFLPRLTGVRQTGPDQYLGNCPAHKDKSPSLSVKECNDGRVLVHCFAGCETGDIMAAVGLSLADLYETPLFHSKKANPRERKQYGLALSALRALPHEIQIVILIAGDMLAGKTPSQADIDRLSLALSRLKAAKEIAA